MIGRILQSKALTVIILVLLFFMLLAVARIWWPLSALKRETSVLNQKLVEARNRNEDIVRQDAYFQSREYLERQLRLKFHYKKIDEEAVLIYKNESVVNDSKIDLSSNRGSQSKWRKWLAFILGI